MTTVTPMIHVPDIDATAAWYARLGFKVEETASDGCETVWARLTLGENAVMLNCGGRPAEHDRRDVDLYVVVDALEDWRARMPADIEIIQDLHLAYHGMREFIVRDLNGFWITFGQWVGVPEG
ncbi:VOC family protein [Brevundimonas sp.]|uniref:VOC family protein n=1 Tax=Brevundimonas sp. TaxID=1871086 RepID=UPI002EDB55AE